MNRVYRLIKGTRKAAGYLHSPLRVCACLSVLCMLLISCNGGGGGGTFAGGGIGGTGISQGPVTGFGSVFVNGIEHFLSGTNIQINGQPAPNGETDLKLGMVVRVAGTVDSTAGTGTATDVKYAQNVEGPIDSINLASKTLVVLGQTVLVDSLTVYDGAAGLSALIPGNVVEISGLVDGSFAIHATRVDVEVDTGIYELSGFVANHNRALLIFDITGQRVNYSAVANLSAPGRGPSDGLFIRVQGTRPGGAGTPLLAISAATDVFSPNAAIGEDLEVEGIISSFISTAQFTVSGQPVRTSTRTRFEHGVITDLGNGVRVEVEGSIAFDSVLDAEEITFKGASSARGEAGEFEIQADIESVNVSTGSITLFGVPVLINSSTQLEDERDGIVKFSINDLDPLGGDRVEINAFLDRLSGKLVAESLHRKNAATGVKLQGPPGVVNATQGTIALAGVLVTSDSSTVFRDKPGNIIASSAFFTAAQLPGAAIAARGTLVGVTILAAELKLDD